LVKRLTAELHPMMSGISLKNMNRISKAGF
jgi:hypothetical protein